MKRLAAIFAALAFFAGSALTQPTGFNPGLGVSGDLSGFLPRPQVSGILGQPIVAPSPVNGQCLVYVGVFPNGNWNAVTCASGSGFAANSVRGNATASPAVDTDLPMPSCSTNVSALIWTTNSGFGCNTLGAVNTFTSDHPITSGDCNTTIQLGTGSTGYLKATLPAVSGFPVPCIITVKNGDTARAKALSGFPSDILLLLGSSPAIAWLGPGQVAQVAIVNSAWATIINPGQWRPTAGTVNIYVDTTNGKDDGTTDGMASGSAFLTMPHSHDFAQQNINISSGAGIVANLVQATTTLTASQAFNSGPLVGQTSPNQFKFLGTGIGSTTITSSTASVFDFYILGGGQIALQALTLTSSGATGFCAVVANGGYLIINTIELKNCTAGGLDTSGNLARIAAFGPYTVTGANNFIGISEAQSSIELGGANITLNSTPSCTSSCYQADILGYVDFSPFPTITGTATGKKCNVTQNAWMQTNGNSANLPGNSACTTGTGGGIT